MYQIQCHMNYATVYTLSLRRYLFLAPFSYWRIWNSNNIRQLIQGQLGGAQTEIWMQHSVEGRLNSYFWLHQVAGGILVPWPGIESMPPEWKCRVLTTGLPGKIQGWTPINHTTPSLEGFLYLFPLMLHIIFSIHTDKVHKT